MASLVALHRRELRRPNDDIYADETFRMIYHSSRRMVERISKGLHDDFRVSDYVPEHISKTFQWEEVLPGDILWAISEETGFQLSMLRSPRKSKPVTRARQLACWLMRENTDLSMPAIGREMNRDHSTVMHACEVIPKLLEQSASLRALHQRVKARLEL